MINFTELECKAERGELSQADFFKLYRQISDLMGVNFDAQRKAAKVETHKAVVENYSRHMAKVFGIENSVPNGDRV